MGSALDSLEPGRICEALAGLLGMPPEDVAPPQSFEPDGVGAARIGPFQFVIAPARSGRIGPVTLAMHAARRAARAIDGAIPVVAAPFMGDAGRKRCNAHGISWLDMSGNGRIATGGPRATVAWKPNRFKQRGRPANAFAPKSSCVVRRLLMDPYCAASLKEISEDTGLGREFVRRVVDRLAEDGLVIREPDGYVETPDPDLLLAAWREMYDFNQHRLIRGRVPAWTGHELLSKLTDGLCRRNIEYAATGMTAEWLLTDSEMPNTVTIYIATEPSVELLSSLDFHEGHQEEENVCMAVPNVAAVFEESEPINGVQCVHPVQAYLDIPRHGGSAREAEGRLFTVLFPRR